MVALYALDRFFLVLPLRVLPQSVQQAGVQRCKQPADSHRACPPTIADTERGAQAKL